MDETQEIINTYYQLLPPVAQAKVLNPVWQVRVNSIAMRYKLSEEQQAQLRTAVFYVLLALEDPDLLSLTIEDELGLETEVAEKIAAEIEETVLGDVRDVLADTIKQIDGYKPTEEDLHRASSSLQDQGIQPAPQAIHNNLPATSHDIPEREVTIQRINTPNPILNKQLEVPVVQRGAIQHQMYTPPKREGQSILEKRLGGSFNLPQEEIDLKSKNQTPEQPRYTGSDPYRESIE